MQISPCRDPGPVSPSAATLAGQLDKEGLRTLLGEIRTMLLLT